MGPEYLRSSLGRHLTEPSIPWLMRYSDRNAMAFSVENRLPFLNPRVVEFALGLPEAHFISPDGLGKGVLREAMKDLVPEKIRRRREHVGFDVPLETWLPRTPGLVGLLEASLEIPAVPRDHAMRLVQAVKQGSPLPRVRAFEAWRLVTLAAWGRTFSVEFD
jgi:asparagine synthase (glutamine-hydrolysing)